MKRIRMAVVFAGAAILVAFHFSQPDFEATAFSTGPPAGHTGGPGESLCTACHLPGGGEGFGPGSFTITPPANYTPGQTHQVVVRHINADPSRMRWGFQMMALAGGNPAGTFVASGGLTQVIDGAGGRTYIEHTSAGTFLGQTGGAMWTVNWVAPATNVGPVTFYAAGNQANGDGTNSGDQIRVTNATSQPQTAQPPRAFFDYDGDGRSDVAVFRPSTGIWYFLRTTAGFTGMQWGISTDKIVPADYDGDRKTDVAVFRPENSTWYIFNSQTSTFITENWGGTGDLAVPADYDGDGKADVSVYRPSDANWYRKLSGGGFSFVNFGTSEDKPVPADYDGDGKADIGVFRPSSGIWYFLRTTAGFTGIQWGVGTDTQIQGDYDGDGKADVAVFRPENGTWYLGMSTLGFASLAWGQAGDIPVAADFDGDAKTDIAVFRPTDANWYVRGSTAGIIVYNFGAAEDKPTHAAYIY